MLMTETIQGNTYVNQTEAAKLLGITSQTFREKAKNVWHLRRHKNPRDEKEVLYLRSDVEKLAEITPAEE